MTREELRDFMAALRGNVSAEEKVKTADVVEVQFAGYISTLEPLEKLSRTKLRQYATWLKTDIKLDPLFWYIGEVVERACILFDSQ